MDHHHAPFPSPSPARRRGRLAILSLRLTQSAISLLRPNHLHSFPSSPSSPAWMAIDDINITTITLPNPNDAPHFLGLHLPVGSPFLARFGDVHRAPLPTQSHTRRLLPLIDGFALDDLVASAFRSSTADTPCSSLRTQLRRAVEALTPPTALRSVCGGRVGWETGCSGAKMTELSVVVLVREGTVEPGLAGGVVRALLGVLGSYDGRLGKIAVEVTERLPLYCDYSAWIPEHNTRTSFAEQQPPKGYVYRQCACTCRLGEETCYPYVLNHCHIWG